MPVKNEIYLISQGLILDHFGKLFFSSGGFESEDFGRYFTENLEGVELFDWVKEKPGWQLALLKMYTFTTKELGSINATNPDVDVKVTDPDRSCKWPNCEDDDELDEDHILPKSGLRGDVLNTHFIRYFESRFGEGWNGQYLCPHHNRAMKLNSVGIGLAFLMLKEEE